MAVKMKTNDGNIHRDRERERGIIAKRECIRKILRYVYSCESSIVPNFIFC